MITNGLSLAYSFCFDYIVFMLVPFRNHLFCQNPMCKSEVLLRQKEDPGNEVGDEILRISLTFAVIFARSVTIQDGDGNRAMKCAVIAWL